MKYEPMVMIEALRPIREATNPMKCLHWMMIETRWYARRLHSDIRGERQVMFGRAGVFAADRIAGDARRGWAGESAIARFVVRL